MTLREYNSLTKGDILKYTGIGIFYGDDPFTFDGKSFTYGHNYIFWLKRKGESEGAIEVKDESGDIGWLNYKYFEIVEKVKPKREKGHKISLILD